jgi:hypothetical protein
MRKTARKLKLPKETLRNLQSKELSQAEGGAGDKYTFTCLSYDGRCTNFTHNVDCY